MSNKEEAQVKSSLHKVEDDTGDGSQCDGITNGSAVFGEDTHYYEGMKLIGKDGYGRDSIAQNSNDPPRSPNRFISHEVLRYSRVNGGSGNSCRATGNMFSTLPRLLSGRKRYKRHTEKFFDSSLIENHESNFSSDFTSPNYTQEYSKSSTMPRNFPNYHRGHIRIQKEDNFLVKLMKHFSLPSHSIATSSPTHAFSNMDGYDRMVKYRHNSGVQNIPSSISNGDISQSTYIINGIPGTTGIKNHGNTCFINAIIQCLSNADMFAEFFVMHHYRIFTMRQSKLYSKKYGTRGEITEQLALLIKSLWSNQYTTEISNKFKSFVSKYGTQYEGSNQHDAQEFLLWLLDKVHEDLNIATKKKYKKVKNVHIPNRPDELVAAEQLADYMRCNSSFIHELFQAQLCSSLVCRSCGYHSKTFDPYLCLSLPVPARQTFTIIVNVTYLRKAAKEVKIGVSIESHASLRELRDKISRLIKVPERQLVILVKTEDNIKELIKDTHMINELLVDMQEVEAIETLDSSQQTYEINSSFTGPSETSGLLLTLLWINFDKKFFGSFFTIQIAREVSFKEIQSELIKSMKTIFKKGIDLSIINDSPIFRIRVVDSNSGYSYLAEDVDHPLYTPVVDYALSHCEEKDYRAPEHLELILEWDSNIRHSLLILESEINTFLIDSNIEYVKARSQKSNRASLNDCFDMYFREERLANDNAWMCPSCKRRQQCIKKLNLWSVPDIFIINLKRFRQASSTQRSKLSTFVVYPLTGLDMNSYLVPRSHRKNSYTMNGTSHQSSVTLPAIWSAWQRPRNLNRMSMKCGDNVFDLYAVCNHHGSMQSGHYTAYCKNPIDGKWYSFDDTKVNPISEKAVVNGDAYILFYQKSGFSSLSCASSSTSGYSSADTVSTTHWSYKMPPFHYWSPKSSRSQYGISEHYKEPIKESINQSEKIYATLGNVDKQANSHISAKDVALNDLENIQKASSCSFDSNDSIEKGKFSHFSGKNESETEQEQVSKKYWTVTSV